MLRGLGRTVRGAVVAAARGTSHAYSAGRCGADALSGSSRACSAAYDLPWGMPQWGSQPSPVPAASPRESVRGIRTSSAAHGDCFFWTGDLGSCPAGDACKDSDSHTPGIPSPYRFCPDWTGERGSCPRGMACKGVVLHVPGRPSPTLQAHEDAELDGEALDEYAAAASGAGLPHSAGDVEAPEAWGSQGAALASLGEDGAGEGEEEEDELDGEEQNLYQAPLEDGEVEGEDADLVEGADGERGEDGEGEGGDVVEAAALAEGNDVEEASDEGDELEDGETDEEDYLDLYEAAAETQLAFEEMFTRPPQGKPPHPDAEGADAWDPAPPSAALIEPGVERLSSPMYDIDDFDTMMDEWERLIIKGHHGAALTLVENAISDVPSLPPLHELQRRKSDRELRKEAARARAAALRAMYAARRIVRVNEHGYAHGAGRRKTSSAQVWLQAGTGNVRINRMPLDVAFPTFDRRIDVLAPFQVTDTCGDFDMVATVRGGGEMGQSQAVRLALSRALENYHPPLRADLKPEGFMTRDPRMVERKKPGRKKARKAFQWVKR